MTLFSIGDLQISNISSSRMMRTGGIPLLDSSTISPYGIERFLKGTLDQLGFSSMGGMNTGGMSMVKSLIQHTMQ